MGHRYDVAILGGGPAGTATAIALARIGRAVVVLERSQYDRVRIGETLPPIAQLPLTNLGVRDLLVDGGHMPVPGATSAWGQAELYEEDFIFNAYGHGWHLDRRCFDARLAATAEDAGARVYRGARMKSCAATTSGDWAIEFQRGDASEALHASFLVDATGRAASFARRQGTQRIDYDRLVGVVEFSIGQRPAGSCDSRTLVEAGPCGWWYSAHLPSGRFVVAYMTDADLFPRGTAHVREHWNRHLHQAPHTRTRVALHGVGAGLNIVSASSSILDRVSGERWLAVGDAALTYDPLSSFGICRALKRVSKRRPRYRALACEYDGCVATFAQSAQRDFQEYLATRAMQYGREQRWPSSSFWQRRQPAAAAGKPVIGPTVAVHFNGVTESITQGASRG